MIQNIGLVGSELLVDFDVDKHFRQEGGKRLAGDIGARRGHPGGRTDTERIVNTTDQPDMTGSPLAPVLANMYIYKLEREFEKSPLQPRALMRYLDDYFALNEFLNFINQLDERIKFTMELEQDERIPFLDMDVMRSNGTLIRRLYRKNS
ncbi:unnamed protein product [Protopolystoma xenopodis]|uniref:Reverse transcriptase domain-containing protein n=1 Tax=Protopolystoma xenopodis TaxID=117903 RepID=A0A448XEI3_9PLAT|nr:unnamed protein product [Protopolystoma xenopodis]